MAAGFDPTDDEWRRYLKRLRAERDGIALRLVKGECATLEDYRDFVGQLRAYDTAIVWATEESRDAG